MSITRLTFKAHCAGVAARWEGQYERSFLRDPAKRTISKRLNALAPECTTPEVINAIIGNNAWTRFECDECGQQADALARIGGNPLYDEISIDLCEGCLRNALDAI